MPRAYIFTAASTCRTVAAAMRALILILPLLASCTPRAHRYDSEVRLVRVEVIRRDAAGVALTTDVELSFGKCPGDQRKTIRGDKIFSACILKHKQDQVVPVKISHEADEQGTLGIEILAVGECEHHTDPNDDSSFTLVQECTDLVANSVKVGFHCNRKPNKELLDKCPWFRTQ